VVDAEAEVETVATILAWDQALAVPAGAAQDPILRN